ncbi:nodulation protein NfeD [Candidatus Acetothermia bacterium]|nr:MAG: nodulation protein NfeD [Candidatus Acetothermia bacterium]
MRKGFLVPTALVLAVSFGLAALSAPIVRLSLDTSINPISRDYTLRGLDKAEEIGASLIVIEINTPGGLESSMRDIVSAELSSTIPIAVFVSPKGARAASAGTFITLAADIAAMAPGTNIGAAHPVSLVGTSGGEEGSTEAEKAANDAAAFARSIAEKRGRNVEWAEKSVLESAAISAEEALQNGVIDLIAEDFDDLLLKLDGYTLPDGRTITTEGLPVMTIEPNLRERLLGLLADPNLVYILFILGLYGLIYEFFHPGVGFSLAAGGICLLLALFGLQILPVNVVGVVLILFGIGLIILDAFTPTNGILTGGGVVSLLAGSFTLFDIPDRAVGLSWGTIIAVVAVTTALFAFVISKALLIQKKPVVTGREALIGRRGVVRRELNPKGTVFINGEYWNARSSGERIPAGANVIVERIEGGTLIVREV